MDTDLRTAADSINGGIGATTITISAATAAAVKTAGPGPVAAAIPAGLDPDLLRATIVVYSELVSRRDAMAHFAFPGSYDRLPPDTSVSPNADEFITCLGHGNQAAADFPADLPTLEQLAASRPPAAIAPASSRAAADLAVLVSLVDLTNGCSDQCGGEVMRKLPTITWTTDPAGASTATGTFSGNRTESDSTSHSNRALGEPTSTPADRARSPNDRVLRMASTMATQCGTTGPLGIAHGMAPPGPWSVGPSLPCTRPADERRIPSL